MESSRKEAISKDVIRCIKAISVTCPEKESRLYSDLGLNSLSSVELTIILENKFKIEISLDEWCALAGSKGRGDIIVQDVINLVIKKVSAHEVFSQVEKVETGL